MDTDLSLKGKKQQQQLDSQSKMKVQICGLIFKVSLSWRHNEEELESFTKALLNMHVISSVSKIHAFCPYPEKLAIVKEKLFGAEIFSKLRHFQISLKTAERAGCLNV